MGDRAELLPNDSQKPRRLWVAADCGHVTRRVWKMDGLELCGDCMLRRMNAGDSGAPEDGYGDR